MSVVLVCCARQSPFSGLSAADQVILGAPGAGSFSRRLRPCGSAVDGTAAPWRGPAGSAVALRGL